MSDSNPIILALDTPDLDLALETAHSLREFVGCFKIGLELFTAQGTPRVLEAFKDIPIFADVKFSDIPNTVAAATNALTRYPVRFIDVHASCGIQSIRAASFNKRQAKLLAVTLLTSIDSNESLQIFGTPAEPTVLRFAKMALSAGADGIVCSPKELELISKTPELKPLIKVTPGIRPSWAPENDQRRSLTPAQALRLGADYIVIGRPITLPPKGMSARTAAQKVLEELEL